VSPHVGLIARPFRARPIAVARARRERAAIRLVEAARRDHDLLAVIDLCAPEAGKALRDLIDRHREHTRLLTQQQVAADLDQLTAATGRRTVNREERA